MVSIKIVKLNRFQCEQCGGEMFPAYYKGIHGQEYRQQGFRFLKHGQKVSLELVVNPNSTDQRQVAEDLQQTGALIE